MMFLTSILQFINNVIIKFILHHAKVTFVDFAYFV